MRRYMAEKSCKSMKALQPGHPLFIFLHAPARASRFRQGRSTRPLRERPLSSLVAKSPRPSRRTSATAFAGEAPDADDALLGFAPYLHPAPRRNSITPAKQRGFIATLAATGIVTQAARSIGVSLEALYKLRRLAGAEGFAAAWEAALDHGVARLEDCALALALEGEELPIVSGGQMLGTYRKHNFGFIRFLLAQRRGGRFSDGSGSYAALVPGHPVYERLHAGWEAEVLARRAAEADAIVERINVRLDQMRERAIAAGEYVEVD